MALVNQKLDPCKHKKVSIQSWILQPRSILSRWIRYRRREPSQQHRQDWLIWCPTSSKVEVTSMLWPTAPWQILFKLPTPANSEEHKVNHHLKPRKWLECKYNWMIILILNLGLVVTKHKTKRSSWPTEWESKVELTRILLIKIDLWVSMKWTTQEWCFSQQMIQESMRCYLTSLSNKRWISTRPRPMASAQLVK